MAATTPATATPTELALPPGAVVLVPAPPHTVPLRPPDEAWGLVIVAAQAPDAITANLVAGIWLPEQPPADLYDGDVVVRLKPPYSERNPNDPKRANVGYFSAEQGEWRTICAWRQSMTAQWPHEIAWELSRQMRRNADAAQYDAQWLTITGSIGASRCPHCPAVIPRRTPDALADLIKAGLVKVGEKLVWGTHTATVREGGLLHDDGPLESTVSTVTSLATSLAGYPVNGWHFWRRARDNRPLSELRAALALR
ncbi:hypothetical protein [Amycolatopsis sp. NPDC059657]|uniref:restriction system modified-DNA reader domain-containing protein n=1 Tax=Amycolatopsis sp. NPDC059657 TaxID=3346899 RepID=UPI0036708E90